jgi:RNA polymerase-interacting CarD/CdnL/TRCF family regulator
MYERTDQQIAAQVAVEAVANQPWAFEQATCEAVLRNGEANNVAELYLELIRTEEERA